MINLPYEAEINANILARTGQTDEDEDAAVAKAEAKRARRQARNLRNRR